MKNYSGSCHCGKVVFSFVSKEIKDGMRCNCSICKRKGAAMTNFTIPPENFKVNALAGSLSSYQFDGKVAKHHFCNHCGIFTFVETRLNPGEIRVNLGCIEEINNFNLPSVLFDGEKL